MAHFVLKKGAAVLSCCAITAVAFSSLAGADELGAEHFEGTCALSGTVRHQPPMTQQPAPTTIRGSFRGTCSGQFTDRDGRTRRLDGAPAAYEPRGSGELSCLGGTATGTGSLDFGRGQEIEFRFTERAPPPGWQW